MYNTIVMSNKLEITKKRLIYRASYRGTKEMDILLSSFVNKYVHELDEISLLELENFLNLEDDVILNFYNNNVLEKKVDLNSILKLFKSHKI
jgi:antitoxin CptB